MTKPMYCPMSFRTSLHIGDVFECTPDCAWAVFDYKNDEYCCSIASIVLKQGTYHANWRPLEDDSE